MSEPAFKVDPQKFLSPSDDERDVTCMRCGKKTPILLNLWEAVKSWNRQYAADCDERAARGERIERPNLIRGSELVVCDDCTPAEREARNFEAEREFYTTKVYLRDLRAGRHNPETRAWLRRNGHAEDVARILREEGFTE